MRRGDAFAFAVEGDTGDGGGVRETANLFAAGVEQKQVFADAAGEQAIFRMREAGGVIHPFHAEIGELRDPVRGGAIEFAVIAAGDEAGFRQILGQRQDGAVMRLDLAPVRAIAEMYGAVAHGKGRFRAGSVEAAGGNMGAELARGPAGLQ